MLRIIGVVVCVGLIGGILLGKAALDPPVWSTFLLGTALVAIPAKYSLNLKRALAWIVLMCSVFLMASSESGLWTLVGFVVFGLSGAAADLAFDTDHQSVDAP